MVKTRCLTNALLLGVVLCFRAEAAEPAKRPNIIIILADDMGFSDAGCYGGEISTPNLDRLASAGLRFTQFYNASKCAPTRASLLSGLYWQEAERGLKRGITIGQALHSVGYTTLAVGKWHLDGNPVDRGFDHWFGFLTGSCNYFRGNGSFHLDHEPFAIPPSGFYTTDAFTDYAIRFLDEARSKAPEKPIFLYLAYNAPHDPLQAPAQDIARYRGKYLKGWDKLREERYQRQITLGIVNKQWQLSPRPENIPPWDSLRKELQQFEDSRASVYAAMIDRMDQNIGRLLAKLRELKMEEDTLIVFLSDNGAEPFDRNPQRNIPPGGPDSRWECGAAWANLSNSPFRFYKRNQHEGGIATPFIVRWPAVIKNGGAITDQPAHIIDIMATCVQLSGCEYTKAFEAAPTLPATATRAIPPLDGQSLLPLFEGKTWPGHDTLFFQLRNHRAIRARDWKLSSYDGRPWELYRMDTDRTEVHDLAKEQPDKVKELDALYSRWWSDSAIDKNMRPDHTPGYIDPLTSDKERQKKKEARGSDDSNDD